MLIVYSLLLFLLWPLVMLAFVWKYGLRRTLRGLPERLGMGAGPGGKTFPKGWLWIHAASVGEVKAADGFLRALPQRFPGYGRLLTTTTVTGKELAEKAGVADCVRLAPADLPFCLHRLLDRWRPAAVVLVETELWPNWLAGLRRRRIPTMVVNGRVSDRSFPRYLALQSLWEPLLFPIARLGVQSPAHASRFLQLGAHPDRVIITGNIKFDVPLPDLSRRDALKVKFGFLPSDVVWVCGSTHPGEEEVLADILSALRTAGPSVKMILAPRHVERAQEVAAILSARGLSCSFKSTPASSLQPPASVLILDTLGELAEAYGAGNFAFVGGSFAPRGGQNPLEPARWEIPVLFGPHMENFREMSDHFLAEKAALSVADGPALRAALERLLNEEAEAALLGRAARRAAESQRGALEESFKLLSETLESRCHGDGAGECGSSCGGKSGCHA